MGAGRFLCVAVPLILTAASLVSLLYATLAGITHQNLRLFRINTTDLSLNPADLASIASAASSSKFKISLRADATKSSNITASDLGLADYYDVTLWNFCSYDASKGSSSRNCSAHQFDWATKHLSTANLTTTGDVAVQLPKTVRDAIEAFQVVTKWAEIVSVVALIALAVELVVGFFATFSRVVSCITWVESTLASALVASAAGLATALALIVVGVVDSTAKFYGVHASLDKSLLATVWISAAFAVAASLFWILTVCCCKPEKRVKDRRSRNVDSEKLLPTGGMGFAPHKYEPLGTPQQMTGTAYHPNGGRADLAYEPYSHRA